MKSVLLPLILSLILSGCVSDDHSEGAGQRASHIHLTWSLLDDALLGDDKRTSIFTLTNQSYTPLPPGWTIYFSQFPHSVYLPAAAINLYSLEQVNGDLYKLQTLDSFPTISAGGTYEFSYQWPVRIFKYSHGPLSPYIQWPDGSVEILSNFELLEVPPSLSFMTETGEKKMQKTSSEIFDEYANTSDLPASELSPILPTPKTVSYTGQSFTLQGGSIFCQPDLEAEANFLLEKLKLVCSSSFDVVTGSDTIAMIKLGIDEQIPVESPEGYQLSIDSTGISIKGRSQAGVFYGIQSLLALIPPAYLSVAAADIPLAGLEILDEPKYAYRGQHLDVARNFQSVASVKKILDVMAMYKLNKFHFHLTDDEGWRLEIPGLPELTDIGGKRGADPNITSLPPAYGSGADPSLPPGSGYYSREEYIDILRYATARHIEVIPEINGPGHARAAIKAMEARSDRLIKEGKESDARAYLLHDIADESKYSSAQAYTDNVICVCKESTYTFLEKVIGEIVKMYEEAGAPFKVIHTGGDEVPHGAWTGSPECQRLIDDEPNIHTTGDLHPYFVQRYLNIAEKHGLKIAGWEEITQIHTPDGNIPNPTFLNKGVISYSWNAVAGWGGEDMAYQLANAGYEVVMCNASNLYFDLSYNYEPDETGLFWAGFVDTRSAFEITPDNIFKTMFEDKEGNPLDGFELARTSVMLQPDARKNLIGIQGHLWSEAVKSQEMAHNAILPKMFGLAERAWSEPAWNELSDADTVKQSLEVQWTKFANKLGKSELKRLDFISGGYSYRVSPPGIKLAGELILMNTEYPGMEIRYTTDGREPTKDSPLYKGAIEKENFDIVKAKTFTSTGRGSKTIVLDTNLEY